MIKTLDSTIIKLATEHLTELEKLFESDVIFFYGPIHPSIDKRFRDCLEGLASDEAHHERLTVILNTPGGAAETVEKLVVITRHFFREVDFVVPDYALSAGTIFCMSGDRIWMDYSSSLGPIDPQVFNGTNWVPALGYLDKVEELIEKSRNKTLTQAEFLMLKDQDLAMLRSYEQARDLTVSLLKEWLVKYKFKNWNMHETTPALKGKPVTTPQKQERAEEIAKILGDNRKWHSHGRSIGLKKLQNELKLKIEDYSKKDDIRKAIRTYNDLICDYIVRMNFPNFIHSRVYY